MKDALVVSDQRQAILYTWSCGPNQRVRLVEQARVRSAHEDEHERRRPDLLGRGTPTGPQHLVSPGHAKEEEARRFAAEVLGWADREAASRGLDRITLFAPARLLGALRTLAPSKDRIELREAELAWMPASQLARHPAVAGLPGSCGEGAGA
jgi:protein required for attachment to host cells